MRFFALTSLAVAGLLAGAEDATTLAASPRAGDAEAAGVPLYAGGGRRDPFVRRGHVPGTEATACGARGLEAVRARDLALRGIVRTRTGFLALVVGPRGESHIARAGNRLCDGAVRAIEPAGVTLEADPEPGDLEPLSRLIRVRLHAQ